MKELAPPAPCEGCVHRKICEEEKLACEAFAWYCDGLNSKVKALIVSQTPDTIPCRGVYFRLFGGE